MTSINSILYGLVSIHPVYYFYSITLKRCYTCCFISIMYLYNILQACIVDHENLRSRVGTISKLSPYIYMIETFKILLQNQNVW